MKIRSLIVAASILLALVGALYWSEHRSPSAGAATPSADSPPAILKLDQAAITRVELKKRDAQPIVLSKDSSGAWHITEPGPFGADASAVSSLLSSLSSLNSERLVEDKASRLQQYGLEPPAVEVDLTQKDNRRERLLIGDETPAGSAVYAMLAGEPRVFTLASYRKTSIDKNLNDLRDTRLLGVSADRISRLVLIRGNQTMEFGRNRDEWQISKPGRLRADRTEVGALAGKLCDARMDLGRTDQDLEDAASLFARALPVAIAKLTDPGGTQELEVRKRGDTYYAKSSVVKGAYRVASDLGQALDRKLDDFRNKKLFDFGFSDPGRIEMHRGLKASFLVKGGQDWWSDGKRLDAASVQSYVANLRGLAATGFAVSGFTTPAIEVTVTSEDGKHVEKVLLAKSGGSYIARRENEPTLYQLDSGAVEALQKSADEIRPAAAQGK